MSGTHAPEAPDASQPHVVDDSDVLDVLVVGGGAAGLSGAVTLARARRSVVVLDAGEQRNLPATGVHAFLTRDGVSPADLVEIGAAEVRSYGGEVVRATVTSARRRDDGRFAVVTDDGRERVARRLLVTTGVVDELPDVPGLRELWGLDVIHCPYCHGWEVRDLPIGVLGTGPMTVHQATLFRQWTDDLTVFTHDAPPLTDDEAEAFAARGVRVVPDEVVAVEATDGRLTGVRLATGDVVPVRALTVTTRLAARAGFLAELGLDVAEHPMGVGTHVATVDPTGRTAIPGVWVAGNLAEPMTQVVAAAASGTMAGAMLNADLVAEDTRVAVERLRAAASPWSADADRRVHDAMAGDHRHGLVTS